MDSKKPTNRITEIVRLQQTLKKWKKLASAPKGNDKKTISFLKRTLSFPITTSTSHSGVPKGYLAVCVGEEMKRHVIPMEYLGHRAFGALLREAEEEFEFQQEGILRIPCEVSVFQSTLKALENKKKNKHGFRYCSSEAELAQPHDHPRKPVCT